MIRPAQASAHPEKSALAIRNGAMFSWSWPSSAHRLVGLSLLPALSARGRPPTGRPPAAGGNDSTTEDRASTSLRVALIPVPVRNWPSWRLPHRPQSADAQIISFQAFIELSQPPCTVSCTIPDSIAPDEFPSRQQASKPLVRSAASTRLNLHGRALRGHPRRHERAVEDSRARGTVPPSRPHASVDGSNPAICGHRKPGHFRRPETGVEFYFTASCVGKVAWTLVRQLRGPHLSMWA